MGKPMTAEAKARLAQLSAENRGRKTLKGLDGEGWMAALDAVQDGDARAVFPDPKLIEGGVIYGPMVPKFRWVYSRDEIRHDKRQKPMTVYATRITHVRLRQARDDQHADVIRWLGAACVPVVERVFDGVGNPPKAVPFFLYPVAPMLKLVYAIWPGPRDDWRGKAAKYLFGYTAAVVRARSPFIHGYDIIPNQPSGWLEAVDAKRHQTACQQLAASGYMFDYKPRN